MGMDIYGEIYYGIIVGEMAWNDEADAPGYMDPETEENLFDMDAEGAHLLNLGSYESEDFVLGYEVLHCYWGQPTELTHEIFLTDRSEMDASIKERAEILGIEYTPPKLYLSALFSY
jgi:hypothetical protein